ncbi:MAG TPA: hypothetical protein VGN86_02425 [Pyrinomonadaceae bacterium]|jgi:hypothetical protein|nr:hypothetical protein [Pyrinomonadaceae bacterium]
MEELTSQVEGYMNNEEACLQAWYRDYSALATIPGEPVARKLNMDEMRQAFLAWLERNRETLFNLICVEWDFARRRKEDRFQNRVLLAAALADFLLSSAVAFPAPITTSVLLVKTGLDELCS